MTRKAPINTDASANSQYLNMPKAFEKCDAPVNTKLQSLSNSPYQRHAPMSRNLFSSQDEPLLPYN